MMDEATRIAYGKADQGIRRDQRTNRQRKAMNPLDRWYPLLVFAAFAVASCSEAT